VDEEKTLTEVTKMERRIPLLEELRSEAVRLATAAGGEGGDEIFRLIDKLERALRFLLAVTDFAQDKVVYPSRLQQRLKDLGLR
jgi:hypothetical protein